MARSGTLENPEVVEDVPGHIIPILEHEFDDFDNEAEKFLDGQTPETEFIGFRLKQGVYGQRQADVQMCRIKLPFGGITPDQMDTLSPTSSRTYAPLNKAHVTTRQNIQIHHIPLRQMAELIRKVSDSGLSSREGCGNTVRNVTADPWAGVCEDEVFDPTPYVGAYVRYFVRHPTTQLMPRKIKTAFTGAEPDRAITGIHDIAFLARERDGVRGFEVRVGGGTSIMPRIAPTLYDFVEAENGDYLKVAEAVFRIFNDQDWLRVNRARARIKVFVDKFGIDELRTQVEEQLKGDWVAERDFTLDKFDPRRGGRRPRRPGTRTRARTATPASSSASSAAPIRPAAPGRLLDGPHPHPARRPDAGAVPRPRPDHARLHRRLRPHDRPPEPRAALGARRGRSTTCGSALKRARSRPARAPTRSPTSSPAPGPTPASSASPPPWA